MAMSDEMLFHGGLVFLGCVLAAAIIYLIFAKVNKAKLDVKLDAEYGHKTNRKIGKYERKKGE